ncbi:MAG TPA: hypothetical protein VFZ41_03355 [Solirubrobacterales bacterium]
MELERLLTSGIAADHATASGLFNKLALDDPATLRNCISPASRAAIIASPLEDEHGLAVATTSAGDSLFPV